MIKDKESVLASFDAEVNERCLLISAQCDNLITSIRGSFDIALIGIPDVVKKMPLKRLIEEYNGDIIAASLKNNQKIKHKSHVEKPSLHTSKKRAE